MSSIRRTVADVAEKLVGARIVSPSRIGPLYEEEHIRRIVETYDIDCIFDVGANEGQYARKLRQRCGYKGLIVSFEPIPHLARLLQAAAESDPLWIVRHQALDSEVREAVFHVTGDTQFSSLRAPNAFGLEAFGEKIKVHDDIALQTTTIALEFPELQRQTGFRRPYLKMDTQGCDIAVATGAGDCLQQFLAVQTEASIRKLYDSVPDLHETMAFFSRAGFDVSAFVPNNDGHFPLLLETDCIFVNRRLIPSGA